MKTLNLFPAQEQNEQLVTVNHGQVVTTSLKVAEYFGKQHKDVLKAINLLDCTLLFRERNIALSCYSKKNGNVSKSYPMYYLTRDGFTLLAMGFTGKVATRFKEAYIEAFNHMEETLKKGENTRYAKEILKGQILDFNKRMKEGVANGRKRHGESYGGCGDVIPHLPFLNHMSFEENLKNALSWISCAYGDSMYFISQLSKKEDEVKRLRKLLSKISNELNKEVNGF